MKNLHFKDRVLIYFFTVIFLPILTLGVIAPALYSRTVAKLSTDYTSDMVERVTQNIDLMIHNEEKLLTMCMQYKALREFFFSSPPNPDGTSGVQDLFASVCESHPEITGIIAVTANDRSFSGELQRISRDPLTEESWFTLARNAPSEFGLVTRPIGRNLRNTSGIGPDEIISIIKAVYHPRTNEFSGVLMADLNQEYLEASFEGTARGDKVFFYILDSLGNYVYAPVNEIVYRINPQWLVDSSQIAEKRILDRDYGIIFTNSAYTGWKTVGVYHLQETMQAVNFVRVSALLIALITFALTVSVSMIYTSAISKPVLALRNIMHSAGRGDLAVRYHSSSGDEIDELGRGLNSMLDQIQNLIDMVYTEQKSKREAELRILQQQIKPHFLYNTLDTIQWMAQEQRAPNIIEVVSALTKLFRVTLSQGHELITLDQEIEHVHSYLIIQKVRYEDKFGYSVEYPPQLKNLKVLKMILQPLVENSIYHGIKEKTGSGSIRVTVYSDDDRLLLKVADNGVGIPPEKLTSIQNGLLQLDHDSDRSAFALYNVNDRIRLTYGEDYGVSIDSSPDRGTVVLITHPLIREKEG